MRKFVGNPSCKSTGLPHPLYELLGGNEEFFRIRSEAENPLRFEKYTVFPPYDLSVDYVIIIII